MASSPVAMQRLLQLLLGVLFALAGPTPAQQAPADYLLGPGDIIRITVFQNPDLTTETRVSEAGTITFPLIGSVSVGGQPTSHAESVIARQLRDGGFVNRPQVNVVVIQFKASQVTVLGQVNKPGRYPLEQSKNRLTEMLALAGGVTPLGADVVTVISVGADGKERKFEVDVPALAQSGSLSKDIPLQNGDVVFVPRYPVFYIYGEVQRPGQYRLERDMMVMQAIAAGGGLTLRGTERGLRMNRRALDGKIETKEIGISDPLQPDDVVFVRESLF